MNVQLLHGHCIARLNQLPEQSVHAIVTSPPYYKLRRYDTEHQIWDGDASCEHDWVKNRYYSENGSASSAKEAYSEAGSTNAQRVKDARWYEDHTCSKCGAWKGELGHEPTPADFVRHLVTVMAACHRVLRDDGSLWLNIADSYAAGGHGSGGGSINEDRNYDCGGYQGRKPPECWKLKKKDMMLIPHRLIIALQEFGWYVRSENIWSKSNPMRSSATDRTTLAHEYIWHLTKQEHYFYDWFAISTPVKTDTIARMFRGRSAEHKNSGEVVPCRGAHSYLEGRLNESHLAKQFEGDTARANRLSVWTIPAANFRGAHFATFPAELARTCILASTSEVGCCAICGTPYERLLEKGEPDLAAQQACGGNADGLYLGEAEKDYAAGGAQNASEVKTRILAGMVVKKTIGWKRVCMCDTHEKTPCVVADPFCGSGTVGEVCTERNLDFIGIDLNPEYQELQKQRTAQPSLKLA